MELEVLRKGYLDPTKLIFDPEDRRQVLYDPRRDRIIRPVNNPHALRAVELLKDHFAVESIEGENVIQRKIRFPNHSAIWSSVQVRHHSRFILELHNLLQGLQVNLFDGHPLNLMYEGPHPRWIDIGSLRRMDEPDVLCEQQVHQYAALADFYRIGYCKKMREHYYFETGGIEEMLQIGFESLAEQDPVLTWAEKFYRLRDHNYDRESHWSGYSDPIDTMGSKVDEGEYAETLIKVIDKYNIGSMVDIGCNNGRYSTVAARRGVEVLAIDIEDSLICELFEFALKEDLPITPIVGDLNLYCRQIDRCIPVLRPQADLILGFAILHHMVHRADYNFNRFFDEAERFSPKAYLITFVDYSDFNLGRRTDKKDWYRLEIFQETARTRGFQIECIETNDSSRRNILLTRS